MGATSIYAIFTCCPHCVFSCSPLYKKSLLISHHKRKKENKSTIVYCWSIFPFLSPENGWPCPETLMLLSLHKQYYNKKGNSKYLSFGTIYETLGGWRSRFLNYWIKSPFFSYMSCLVMKYWREKKVYFPKLS